MDSQNVGYHPCLKPAVVITGTANEGTAGPAIGHVDIGVSDAAYLFRVALPGLRRKQSTVKCIIESDGKVHIEGVMTETGLVINSSTVYQMKVQQLCAAGPFTISFNLPGSVDTRLFSPVFRPDGILEVVVLKSKMSSEFLYPFDGNKSSPVKFPQVTV
ncbi:increased DNA methylation 3-like [Rosa sericea]